jgi:catechol 2,3-dioxygenase-like lactoylglutathione lyase family enzyme
MEINCILLPVNDLEKSDSYYKNVLGFDMYEDYYKSPSAFGDNSIFLLAQHFRGGSILQLERAKLFRLFYHGDILSLLQDYVSKSVDILTFSEHPGGYYTLIQDPFGNKFEIMADFLDQKSDIKPSDWSFYNRL